MDDLKKKYQNLNNKSEYERDAFEQEALEGFEKTDLNRATVTKKIYDSRFLNKYSSNKSFNLKILYVSVAAMVLVTLMVSLWRFYFLNDSEKELIAVKTELHNAESVSSSPFPPPPPPAPAENNANSPQEFKPYENKNKASSGFEKNKTSVYETKKNDSDKSDFAGSASDALPTGEVKKEENQQAAGRVELSAESSTEYNQKNENKYQSGEMPNSSASAPAAAQNIPSKQITRATTDRKNIKISGEIVIIENIKQLQYELYLFTEKYNLNLTDIEIKEKGKRISVTIKNFNYKSQPDNIKKEFENIIKNNILKEKSSLKIEISDK